MKQLLDKKWIAFLLILITTFLANKLIMDKKYYWCCVSENWQNIIEISLLIIIYFLGKCGMGNYKNSWAFRMFDLIYRFSIVAFIALALIDAYWYNTLFNGKHHRFTSVKFLLLNPVGYLFFITLDKFFNKDKNI